MIFRVILTDTAMQNLRHYYLLAAEYAPRTAAQWLDRFYFAIQTLSQHPERCILAPENESVPAEIRQLRFGKRAGAYRVLFTITDDEVRILHIRRATMDVASPDDLLG
jgi:plasmid stabilization system protein ParE